MMKDEDITRVICASVSRVQGSVMEQLLEIRNKNCGNETGTGVRGALLYSSGWFVLWLEGDEEAVEAVLQSAARDRRNAHQVIIHRSRGPAVLDEAMGVVATQCADGPGAFGRRIYQARTEFEKGIVREPDAVWQQLQTPCTFLKDMGEWHQPERHIAVVAADDHGQIELVRKLGERFRSPVVYQRFAGPRSHSSDVGAAYVDIRQERRVNRVQIVARRALSQRMVRRSLCGIDGLVVMPGVRPSAAVELASAVAACVAATRSQLKIYLMAASDEIAATFSELLNSAVGSGTKTKVVHLPEPGFVDFLLARTPACPEKC